MKIGLAGAHRVGKTTLANQLAAELGCCMLTTAVSKAPVWNLTHTSPSDVFTFAERVELQMRILKYIGVQLEQLGGSYVADRTPLDIVGYLYANIDHTCSDLWNGHVEKIVKLAINLTCAHFEKVILVQPGIDTIEEAEKKGKVYLSRIYQTAINNHILSLLYNYMDPEDYIIIDPHVTNLEARLVVVLDQL